MTFRKLPIGAQFRWAPGTVHLKGRPLDREYVKTSPGGFGDDLNFPLFECNDRELNLNVEPVEELGERRAA
jgi:hypothetical protein